MPTGIELAGTNMKHIRPRSEFLQTMQDRGFLDDCSDIEALDRQFAEGRTVAYIGFDATARSLHVGSLIQIMMLRWLQKCGHRPIVLMGGGTTRIGDPSYRASERPLLSSAQINSNIAGIKQVFSRYINFGDRPDDAILANNSEWLNQLHYIEFLRQIGRHFSVNRMLSFDSVKSRLDREQSLSFLEFNYMILQAYDFLELSRRFDCRVQFGGSDQWGNILNGVDLIRRVLGRQAFALTSPLLTTSDGSKMGKTASGAVWLNADLCSPYEFWQFWRNVADADVGRFLKLYTEIDTATCEQLGNLQGAEINEAKIRLANEVTSLAHGSKAANMAAETARRVFEKGEIGGELPKVSLDRDEVEAGRVSIVQALVKSGLVASGKEAKRQIAGGGVRINDAKVDTASRKIDIDELNGNAKLSLGRKKHVVLCSG
ncbi:MAG: tyrosine--tRNA ligase [Rhodobacteraceae bacterium]|nr:tyrosine--tRNA ligase [Paracoccaceae bacterium]